ncbi:MAG: hypothetical protein L3J28_03545 [Candidatus Polarisedimenticolaceae bacterium]|nr:hypothetical protein [Candidatus Polarisedimenticolaceae bacterium]
MPIRNAISAQKRAALILSIIGISVISQPALAAFIYSGQNKLTFEHYSVEGYESGGIYQFEGWQKFDDFSLNFSDTYSPYSTMRGYIIGSSSHSEYRGEESEKISNFSVVYQTGESALPFRLEVGDYYANQSRHTLQRGLKGIQLELQPQIANAPHSIQLFFGRSATDYQTLFDGEEKDYYLGASWLTESETWGAFALTSVNYQSTEALGEKVENVSGLAWEKVFTTSSFNHTIEAEFAYLSGENSTSDDLDENSTTLKLSGNNHSGYDYLIDLEHNGDLFSPNGASATADRASANLQWGQPITNSINARLRSQHTRSNLSSDNITTTRLTGFNIGGLPFSGFNNVLKGLNINADFYHQDDQDEDKSFERENSVFQLNSSLPINRNLRSRLSYQWLLTDNKIADTRSKRQSVSAGFDYSLALSQWQGAISPTARYVEDRDVAGKQTSNLTLGGLLNIRRDGHNLNLSYQTVSYTADDPTATESTTAQTHIGWNKDWKRHGFAINVDHFNRSPESSENSDSHKFSLAWTYRFAKKASQAAPIQSSEHGISSFSTLSDLALGSRLNSATESTLKQAGFLSSGSSGAYQLYEGRLFNSLENRQVLAIEGSAGSVKSSHILIPIANSAAQSEKVYQKLLDELLATYGSPSLAIERGEFATNWLTALQDNQFSPVVSG